MAHGTWLLVFSSAHSKLPPKQIWKFRDCKEKTKERDLCGRYLLWISAHLLLLQHNSWKFWELLLKSITLRHTKPGLVILFDSRASYYALPSISEWTYTKSNPELQFSSSPSFKFIIINFSHNVHPFKKHKRNMWLIMLNKL